MHLEEFIEQIEPILGDEFAWRVFLDGKWGWKFTVFCRDEGGHVFTVHTVHIATANELDIHDYEKRFRTRFEDARIRERKFREKQLAP